MDSTSTKEKAVASLLQPPALRYVRSVKAQCEKDPNYLQTHREDVGNIIHGFLIGAGFFWAEPIFENEWPDILQEAITRLGSGKS